MKKYFVIFISILLVSIPQVSSAKAKKTSPKNKNKNTTVTTKKYEAKNLLKSKVDKLLNNLKMDVELRNELHTFDNLDMLPTDDSSDQAIKDTDDRATFAWTAIKLGLMYQINQKAKFVLGIRKSGLWGNDQFGNASPNGDAFYFTDFYGDYDILNSKSLYLNLKIGRQHFKIGGAIYDHYLSDIIDAAVITLKFPSMPIIGIFHIVPFDLFLGGSRPKDVYIARYIGMSEPIIGMNGDVNTIRYGLVYENPTLAKAFLPGLTLRAFAYFADIGGVGHGADITYEGRLGNFADNDWSSLFGARATYETKMGNLGIMAYVDGAFSMGIDRTEAVIYDKYIWGSAFTLGGKATMNSDSFKASVKFVAFYAQGGLYASNGQQYSHGFVSMKGDKMGGIWGALYAGAYPSAYVSSHGISDRPNHIHRGSGTMYVHLGFDAEILQRFKPFIGFWYFQDTNYTAVKESKLDSGQIVPPFGYSIDEYYAELRFGKTLGMEFDLGMAYNLGKPGELFLNLGFFFPGEYYKREISKVAGDALGGPNVTNFWTIIVGHKITF